MAKKIAKAAWALALCAGACFAQDSTSALSAQDYLAMRKTTGPAALMLAVCEAGTPTSAIQALEKAGARATVFVSGQAIEGSKDLAKILRARPDLFEVGNLGRSCMSRSQALGSVYEDAKAKKPEARERVAAMAALGENLLAGQASIDKALGAKARFFAFGSDFDNSAADPFESSRLAAGLAAYLKAPGPRARYDALASAKAGFKARVILAKLDGRAGALSGPGSYGEQSVVAAMKAQEAPKLSRKASEVWMSSRRAALARELEGR